MTRLAGVEGAGGKRFPFGRWNRDQGCRLEVVHVGTGYWAECRGSCNYVGPVHDSSEAADADADAHERQSFERRQVRGHRLVRGRWEP